MKITAAETTYYAFGAEYSSVLGWRRVFVSAGGVKVEYRDSQTYFHQADHLGTPRVQTDSAGSLVETWSYYPFGEQWEQTGSGGNEHRYTGHRRDPETGNDYAGARYLKGSKGRWLAVDPVLGSMSNPQRLNRYAYVLNLPSVLVDKNGADPEEGEQQGGGSGGGGQNPPGCGQDGNPPCKIDGGTATGEPPDDDPPATPPLPFAPPPLPTLSMYTSGFVGGHGARLRTKSPRVEQPHPTE